MCSAVVNNNDSNPNRSALLKNAFSEPNLKFDGKFVVKVLNALLSINVDIYILMELSHLNVPSQSYCKRSKVVLGMKCIYDIFL